MGRSGRVVTFRGRSLTLTEWSRKTGIPAESIRSRLDHQGWTIERALTEKVSAKFRPKPKFDGVVPIPCPKMMKHQSGQACSRWTAFGKSQIRYFGIWGSREAAEGYKRFQIEWANEPSTVPDEIGKSVTVGGLASRYLRHVKSYYVKDGKQTSEVAGQKAAIEFLVPYSKMEVQDIKARHLKEIQNQMIAKSLSRQTINQYTWRITRCFRWGVGEDLVPPDVASVLESVPNLQPGRSKALDSEPVMSVPVDVIEKTIPHLHILPERQQVLEAMVRAMLLIGPRPGELCAMSTHNIIRTGDAWKLYVRDKNLHRQAKRKAKLIWIGPRAQALIAPFLANPRDDGRIWCFPPRGKKGVVRTALTRVTFAEFIRLACVRAGVPNWTPHQLRHNRATEVQRLYESNEAAAAAIGDTPQVAAEVYVDPNQAVARRIALATG